MKKLQWTKELSRQFWADLAGSEFVERIGFSNAAAPYLIELVKPFLNPAGRHLDYGAGEGYLVGALLRAGYATAAYEPASSPSYLKELATHPLFLGLIDPVTTDRKFDVVFIVEVIEHLLDQDLSRTMSTVRDILQDGGILIITTPNAEDLEAASVYCPTCRQLFHPWQHVRRFTADSLTELLASQGFERILIHEFDFSDSPSPILERQQAEREVAEFQDALASIMSMGEREDTEKSLAELARSFWNKQFTRQKANAIIASQTSLSLGATSRLVYIGRKSPVERRKRLPATLEKPLTAKETRVGELHNAYLNVYQEFTRLYGEYQELYWQEIAKLLGTATQSSQIPIVYETLRARQQQLDEKWEQYQQVYRAFLGQVKTTALRKHEHIAGMYLSAMQVYDPWDILVSQNKQPKSQDLARQLIRERLRTYPQILSLHDSMERAEHLWSDVSQSFVEHLEILYQLLDLAPYHQGNYLRRRYELIEQHLHFRIQFTQQVLRNNSAESRMWHQLLHTAREKLERVHRRESTLTAREQQLLQLLRAYAAIGKRALNRRVLCAPFARDGERGWVAGLPDLAPGDDLENPTRSTLMLFENESPLGPAHSLHDDIRCKGGGRFSHWNDVLYFSTSDGSDPNTNGRKYTIVFVQPERQTTPTDEVKP